MVLLLLLCMTLYSCYRLYRSISNDNLFETGRLNKRVSEDVTLLISSLLLDLMWFLL